jgi:predicted nucleic acid-binding protein
LIPVFVPDASVALPWCFKDETTAYTDSLLDRLIAGEVVTVPPHWPVEVSNGLVQAKKRGRVDEERIGRFLDDLSSFHILVDNVYDFAILKRVRGFAEQQRLTTYDAAYLELAQRTGLPLATLDSDLQRAARALGVPLLEPEIAQ